MEITFKYQGKIISTPNLEKKLKRMKISINDIEIIDTPIKKESPKNELDSFYEDKEMVIVRSTKDDIQRVCFVKKGTRPPFKKLFEKVKWNPQLKTGIREFTDEFFMTMYYDY